MKRLLLLLLLAGCAGYVPVLTIGGGRYGNDQNFRSSASSGYGYDDDDGGGATEEQRFSNDVTFDTERSTDFWVTISFPLGKPDPVVTKEVAPAWLLDMMKDREETYHEDDKPAVPWYREVMDWTLKVPPLILGMLVLGAIVIAFFKRDSLYKKYKKIIGKDKE